MNDCDIRCDGLLHKIADELGIAIYDNGPGEVYLGYNAKGIRTIKNGYKGKQKSSICMGGSHIDFDCSFVGDKRLRCNNSTDDTTEAISLNQVGEYSGAPYVYLNNNMPYFTDEEKENTKPFENYSSLDDLGRCGVAFANIYKELMPTEERGPIGQIKPSGWHTVKYNGIIDGNYLYNRCHLIGYQLTGENANELNLITGTRYLNTEGMEGFENTVGDYVAEMENHVVWEDTKL